MALKPRKTTKPTQWISFQGQDQALFPRRSQGVLSLGWHEDRRPQSDHFFTSSSIIFQPERETWSISSMEASRIRDVSGKSFFLAACLLSSWAAPILATAALVPVVSIPEEPSEGQNVTLSVQNVTGVLREVNWYRGQATDGSTRIFSYFPGNPVRPQRDGVQSTQREFGFPNGSLLIAHLRPSDAKTYTVLLLLRPRVTLRGTFELRLASPTTSLPSPPTTSTSQTPSVKEPTKPPLMLGWIVAGVVVAILLAGAVGATLVYRFVLYKNEPSTGGLDPRGRKSLAPKHDDKEPIYEVMDSPVKSPKTEGKEPPPMPGPLPPLPESCPNLESNYMELLRRSESIYSEIRR
ncbi:carcinoembryonic antigen-related cell adhesion molecule 19-like [Anolis carolinensis]|uniref:carcinoembryonic antigen-related cell adhesion molecule 19-like n=1 Tax=Anolis carolinensis TaxID=28377 RepID=UPI002F2B4BCC